MTAFMRHVKKEWISDQVADAEAKSETVGNLVCGLYCLEIYCQQLVTGRVNGTVKPTVAKAAIEVITPGWALDKDGNPTTDPDAALQVSLVSMGGYKGWSFGLLQSCLGQTLRAALFRLR